MKIEKGNICHTNCYEIVMSFMYGDASAYGTEILIVKEDNVLLLDFLKELSSLSGRNKAAEKIESWFEKHMNEEGMFTEDMPVSELHFEYPYDVDCDRSTEFDGFQLFYYDSVGIKHFATFKK